MPAPTALPFARSLAPVFFAFVRNTFSSSSVTLISFSTFSIFLSSLCKSKLTLNEGLLTIGVESLMNTYNVKNLSIPSTVTYIASKAFNHFKTTQTITFNCSEEYAIKNFAEDYYVGSSATLSYL